MNNTIIYSWFALLTLILLAGVLYPVWNKNTEHYLSCLQCCSALEKEDYQTCRALCRTSGGACKCCDLAVDTNTTGIFSLFRPTSHRKEIIVNNKTVITNGK